MLWSSSLYVSFIIWLVRQHLASILFFTLAMVPRSTSHLLVLHLRLVPRSRVFACIHSIRLSPCHILLSIISSLLLSLMECHLDMSVKINQASVRFSQKHICTNIVGGLLLRRRSSKQKHLPQCDIRTDIAQRYKPKLQSRELRYNDMPWDEGLHRLKEEETDQFLIICVTLIVSYQWHECNFNRAASRAYK
jgi:hypothetical protein